MVCGPIQSEDRVDRSPLLGPIGAPWGHWVLGAWWSPVDGATELS